MLHAPTLHTIASLHDMDKPAALNRASRIAGIKIKYVHSQETLRDHTHLLLHQSGSPGMGVAWGISQLLS